MADLGFWTLVVDFEFWTLVAVFWISDTSGHFLDLDTSGLFWISDPCGRIGFWALEADFSILDTPVPIVISLSIL